MYAKGFFVVLRDSIIKGTESERRMFFKRNRYVPKENRAPIIDIHIVKAMMKEKISPSKRRPKNYTFLFFVHSFPKGGNQNFFRAESCLFFFFRAHCAPLSAGSCPANLESQKQNIFRLFPTPATDFARSRIIYVFNKETRSPRLGKRRFLASYSTSFTAFLYL